MDVSNRRRIVILGKTGVGKSSVANTIFGEERFTIGHTANSATSECRAETKSINGRNITLIDTPGLFDTNRSEEELKSEIVKCITEFSPGPHAFLIMFEAGRFTEQEQAVITKIKEYFSEEAFKYATVLFTHGDQLEEEQTIEDFIRDNELVSDLVENCGGRCHVIDNTYWKNNQQDEYRSNKFQVKEILNTIEKMIEANKGSCYTNEMLQEVERMIQQEEEHIRQSSGNMSEEEIREKSKERVSKRLLINLAGITTGALLGALFGVVVMVKVVLSALEAVRTVAVGTAAAGTAAAAVGVGVAAAGTAAVGVGVAAAVGTAAAGTAAAGTAAVGVGVAAAVEVGGAAGGTLAAGPVAIVIVATCAVVGAVVGGVAGYYAVEEAETFLEAIERSAKVVMNGSQAITDSTTKK